MCLHDLNGLTGGHDAIMMRCTSAAGDPRVGATGRRAQGPSVGDGGWRWPRSGAAGDGNAGVERLHFWSTRLAMCTQPLSSLSIQRLRAVLVRT